MTQGLDVEGSL